MFPQTTDESISIALNNKFRGWTGPNKESAESRIKTDGYMDIGISPKFKLDPSKSIFTIGSCFAREVENALLASKIPLCLDGHGVAADQFSTWDEASGWGGGVPIGTLSRGALNKYSVHSMTAEIIRVLDDEKHEHEGMIEIKDGLWFDPHSSGLKHVGYEQATKNRSQIFTAMSQIKNAETVILTLGLTETWTDISTGIVMNNPLGGADLRRHKSRFQFNNFNYSETLTELDRFISKVRERCNPDMKFIVTVSPVPMTSTWTVQDVVSANSYSKSTLRAVAAEISSSYSFVDYFPSYEIVTNSPRSMAWCDDTLHVEQKMVDHVIKHFVGAYLSK